MNFMHFHFSCTQNCDDHILLIVTGNAHKKSCHKLLSLILAREQGLIKIDCSGKMVVAFTITEKNYLMVSLFCQLVLPLSYLYLWYYVSNLAAVLVLFPAYRQKRLLFSLYSVLQIVVVNLCVDFFLSLGFYYNDVEYRHKYHNRQHKKKSLLYSIYDGVTRRDPISNVGIVGSVGQASFTYQVLV